MCVINYISLSQPVGMPMRSGLLNLDVENCTMPLNLLFIPIQTEQQLFILFPVIPDDFKPTTWIDKKSVQNIIHDLTGDFLNLGVFLKAGYKAIA